MQPALLIRLRPLGPWRYGPADGAHDRVDTLYRSDRLFSAVTLAMQQLGVLNEWLQATARNPEPALVFSSLFPFQGDTLFVTPPSTLWPPPPAQVVAPNPVFLAKIRWNSVSFVPLAVVDTLLTGGQLLAEQWLPDTESGCLLRRDRPNSSPFRVTARHTAAVDRITRTGNGSASAACVEFEANAGLWVVARYRDTTVEAAWREPVEAAFRLLADSGFGGRRSSGWGQSEPPVFERGVWPALILPRVDQLGRKSDSPATEDDDSRYWMLSLYSPAPGDRIDWTAGDYRIALRAGRVQSNGSSGALKKVARMVEEGSVLAAASEPLGAAVDVAPDGFAHPVYRSGLALAVKLPVVELQLATDAERMVAVEQPSTDEAVTSRICEGDRDFTSPPNIRPADIRPAEMTAGTEPLADQAVEPSAEPSAERQAEEQEDDLHSLERTPEPAPTTEEIEAPAEVQPAPEDESAPPVPATEAQSEEAPKGDSAGDKTDEEEKPGDAL